MPDGTQVIPHDISVQYAKEAARANNSGSEAVWIDYNRLIGGMKEAMSNIVVEHVSTLNGKVVAKQLTPLIDQGLGNKAYREERG